MSDGALLEAMRGRGAAIVDVEAHAVAMSYGDPAGEYRALRERAALVDLPWLGRLHVTGGDRVTFLQGMLSNDVQKLTAGQGCPALLLSEQGKVVADLLVAVGAEEIVLTGVAATLAGARAALERFIIADDVEIAASGDAERSFAVLGPESAAVFARLGVAVPDAAFAHVRVEDDGVSLDLTRVPGPGAGGILCHVIAGDVARWWERCRDVGDVALAGYEAGESMRIESGLPWHGRDVTADTLALEGGYEAAISFRKGCYLGQEVMERVTARGHVNRKLAGLTIEGGTTPASGTRLFADGRDVGWVTSAAWSWRLDAAIALGYVRREHLAPGTTLAVGEAAALSATVRALPF